MKTTLLVASVALALGTLAACDRNSTPQQRPQTSAPSNTAPSSTAPSSPAGTGSSATTTPSAPANAGSGKEGAHPPVQGREDVRQPEQQKDFQQKGDGAGPKPGG
jgi:uncharacterized lipoprotein